MFERTFPHGEARMDTKSTIVHMRPATIHTGKFVNAVGQDLRDSSFTVACNVFERGKHWSIHDYLDYAVRKA